MVKRSLALLVLVLVSFGLGGAIFSPTEPLSFVHDTNLRPASIDTEDTFRVIIIPDSQFENETLPDGQLAWPWQQPRWRYNARWICANAAGMKIAAVLHVGDLVQSASAGDFTEMMNAWYLVRELRRCGMPYLFAQGNHDFDGGSVDVNAINANDTNWRQFFPPAQYSAESWYLASGPNMTTAADPIAEPDCWPAAVGDGAVSPNHAISFAGTFSAIAVGWLASTSCPSQWQWVEDVIDANPTRNFIMVSHAAVNPTAGCSLGNVGTGKTPTTIADGTANLFLTVGGHWTGSNICWGLRTHNARSVITGFSNFQTNNNMSIGSTLVVVKITKSTKEVCLSLYNPTLETNVPSTATGQRIGENDGVGGTVGSYLTAIDAEESSEGSREWCNTVSYLQ